MKTPKLKKGALVEVAYFQQIGIETFPLLLGDDTNRGSEDQRIRFARKIETLLAGGDLERERGVEQEGYDLIVSSWTFCHLIDPLATLELWSNALAVEGELYVNDIDFSVFFESEGSRTADITSSNTQTSKQASNQPTNQPTSSY